jgi:mono/diheme cytochrome c family protein
MPRLRLSLWLAVVAGAIYAASLALVAGADAKPDPQAKPVKDATAEKPAAKKAAKKKLTGQELYAINCNRCHPERYPTEFTAAQWKTIMLEMRVRANLPAKESKAILKYLQEDSGTP